MKAAIHNSMLSRIGTVHRVVLAVIVLALSAARAATPPLGSPIVPLSLTPPTPLGTLDASHPILTFDAAVDNPTPLPLVNDPVPVVCAVGCWEYRFETASTSPFLVSIHSTVDLNGAFNPNDGFVLYVYGPDGALIGAANGI